jgi:hypothetical protein
MSVVTLTLKLIKNSLLTKKGVRGIQKFLVGYLIYMKLANATNH